MGAGEKGRRPLVLLCRHRGDPTITLSSPSRHPVAFHGHFPDQIVGKKRSLAPARSGRRPPAMGVHDKEADARAELGVALSTRNYDALLQNLAARRRPTASQSPPRPAPSHPGRRALSVTTPPPSYSAASAASAAAGNRYSLAAVTIQEDADPSASSSPADAAEVQDRTVYGLPVQTRNYIAMIAGTQTQRHSDTAFQYLDRPASDPHQSQQPHPSPAVAQSPTVSDKHDDVDAVMGLPISTGNYVAYIAGEETAPLPGSHRSRGYSRLADSPAARASAPSLPPSKRQIHQPTDDRDSFPTAPTNGSNSPEARASCFDNRRLSAGVALAQSGHLLVQGSAFKTWKRYHAALSGTEFKYSKAVGQPPKYFGQLTAARRWNGLQFGLLLEFADGTQLHARCESESEYETWFDALERALERSQSLQDQSKTSYTLTAGEQHEGFLHRLDRGRSWRRCYFVARVDGFLECRDQQQQRGATIDSRNSGYVQTVSFADNHAHGLAIQLDSGTSLVCYAESYDDQMMWYAAIAASSGANRGANRPTLTEQVKSTYVHTAVTNHAGWLYKQSGIFKSMKRLYFTLHGDQLAFAKDTNAEVQVCDYAAGVEDWDGHPNGFMLRLKSGRSWKVHAESYESAKRWRSVVGDACRRSEAFSMKKYLASRKRKKLPPVFGGWLTKVDKAGKVRQFYVVDGSTLGVANDIDNELQRLGTVVDAGASRDLQCGIVISLSNGTRIKAVCDSLEAARRWYECLSFSLPRQS